MTNLFKCIFISICLCFIALTHSNAQVLTNSELALLFEKNSQTIMYVGDVKTFKANQLERASISIPHIADITSAENDLIIVAAINSGYTKLSWKDSDGEHTLLIHVLVEDITLIRTSIDELIKAIDLPNIYTKIAKNESKILILGHVTSEEDLERIDQILEYYGEKIINLAALKEDDKSIQIEIDILEVNKGASENIGIEWPTGAFLTEQAARWSTLAGIPDAFFRITDWSRTAFTSQINYLISEGKARILSRPRLVCQSGKEAELLVGGEIPILTSQAITSSSSGLETATEVEYKEYGIKLTINPVISRTNRIKIALNIEVSDIEDAVILGLTTQPTAKAYPISKRTTSTELVLNDAQTLVIGGLIKQKSTETIKKFPFLSSIPILGILFRNSEIETGGGTSKLSDTELVIALTPTIIDPDAKKHSSQGSHDERTPTQKKTALKKIQKNRISKAILNKYVQQVAEKIKNAFIYPAKAKEQKLEGSVQLALQLSSAGQVLDAKITQPSGYEVLDTNSLKIIRQASPYPSFPSEIEREEIWINVPIIYNLK